MDLGKDGGLTRAYRAGILVNVVLIVLLGAVLAIGTVALTRRLAYRTSLRFDLTADRRYALDPLTEELVRGIESPLQITYVWGFDDDLRQRVLDPFGRVREDLLNTYYLPILHNTHVRLRDFLREWQALSPHVRIRLLRDEQDPLAVDAMARDLGLERKDLLNHVHLRMGARERRIPLHNLLQDMDWGSFQHLGAERLPRGPAGYRIHEELTAALRALSSGDSPRIYLPRGLGSRFEPGAEDSPALRSVLEAEGYTVLATDLRPRERLDADGTALILSPPAAALDPDVMAVLLDYESRGGRILVVLDPGREVAYERLLEPYGLSSPGGRVHDPDHVRPGVGESFLFSDQLMTGRHPIVAPLRGRVTLFLGSTRPLEVAADRAPGAERTTILQGSRNAMLIPATYDSRTGAVTYRQDRMEPLSAPSLGVAAERPAGGDRVSRLVVIGSGEVFSARAFATGRVYANRDLLVNSLGWLLDRKSSIGLSPRDELARRFIDPRRLARPFVWVVIVGLPGVLALAGLAVFLRRRQ